MTRTESEKLRERFRSPFCVCERAHLTPLWFGWEFSGYFRCWACGRVWNMGLAAPN